MPVQNIGLCCSLLGKSRQSFYQYRKFIENKVFRDELIIEEVLSIRKYQKKIGGRKLYYLLTPLFDKLDVKMGRDSFFNLLRANNLLVKRRRSGTITTNSNHWYKRYPNLIKGFIPIKPNQLWVSDITYIPLYNACCYLSLVTDAFSRKIVGYYLHHNLTADGTIEALKKALNDENDLENLIHHSDRGAQYCCNAYVDILKKNKIRISMTQNGDPLENPIAERVNGILKDELLENKYQNLTEAKKAVAIAVSIYNHQRPHSSIDNLTPYEAHLLEDGVVPKRLWKNYYNTNKKEVFMQD